MKKIKVLMVAKGMEKNGVSSVILSYIRNINREKFDSDVLTGSHYAPDYKEIIEKAENKFYIISSRDKHLLTYIIKIAKIVRENKYDIVHVHGSSALIFPELLGAWLGGCKIRIAHSHNTTCDHLKLERFVRPLFYCLTTVNLACGNDAGKWMFGNKNFTVIPNGIDLNRFVYSDEKRQIVRKNLSVTSDEFLIGHVGGFNYSKNQAYIIDIFNELLKEKNAKLLLVGEGETQDEVKAKAKKLGIVDQIIFYGLSDDIPSLMMGMDVFVLPSRFEGVPCVLIEAQASGLPCIVSSAVTTEAAMGNYMKFLSIDEKAKECWVRKIIEFAKEDRKQIYLNNLQEIKERGYSISSCINRLENVYFNRAGYAENEM